MLIYKCQCFTLHFTYHLGVAEERESLEVWWLILKKMSYLSDNSNSKL